jgi:hypothetical protein
LLGPPPESGPLARHQTDDRNVPIRFHRRLLAALEGAAAFGPEPTTPRPMHTISRSPFGTASRCCSCICHSTSA